VTVLHDGRLHFRIDAAADVLSDEGEAYAAKLRRARVPVTTVRGQGTIHDFMLLNSMSQTRATRAAAPRRSRFSAKRSEPTRLRTND